MNEYLGIRKPTRWNGLAWPAADWRPEFTHCPAETVAEQLECSGYAPSTPQQKKLCCPSAEDFACVHCDCGCSDVCDLQEPAP